MSEPTLTRVNLERFEQGDQGTFGLIELKGNFIFSGELPWEDNKPNVSRIPPGEYVCTFNFSSRFNKDLYWVKNVPGRAGVRIHPANFCGKHGLWKTELNGCIALGLELGKPNPERSKHQQQLIHSKRAVDLFEGLLNRKDFLLVITENWNPTKN